MPSKNFLLLSMEDDKIKKVSNVISNDSCRKILDYLSGKDATESELAKTLQLPISTVSYNLKQLMETGLIESKEFHYSEKGKEVNHFRLANKYIIIAPKKTFGIKEKLKGILPVALIASGAAFIVQLMNRYLSKTIEAPQQMMAAKSAMAERAADSGVAFMEATEPATVPILSQNIALWFFAGAIFALLVYLMISLFRKRFD
ncbi:helix-turn-helix domain-containing protein [Candidatus Woesearchaeota archaeon]|nr:helix-turn-helix domain-containing protein [Candidatus Woesearchaeota archaeon]